MSGIPFPSNIPLLGNILQDGQGKLNNMVKGFERIAALGDRLTEANKIVTILQNRIESTKSKNSTDADSTLLSVHNTMKSSYGALKELLSKGPAQQSWTEFIINGDMVKVYKIVDGSVHWISKKHIDTFAASDLYRMDQRMTEKTNVEYQIGDVGDIDNDGSDNNIQVKVTENNEDNKLLQAAAAIVEKRRLKKLKEEQLRQAEKDEILKEKKRIEEEKKKNKHKLESKR